MANRTYLAIFTTERKILFYKASPARLDNVHGNTSKNRLMLRLHYVNGIKALSIFLLLRLPVGRGGVINSPRSIFLFFFFSVSEVGLPLMGVTAVHSCLSHDF